MNKYPGKDIIPLPEELSLFYEVISCLKYSETSATYLLNNKKEHQLFLMKTAVDPVHASLLANEKKILERIIQTENETYAGTFPVPVYLSEHNIHISPNTAAVPITFYIRTYIPGNTLEELCETKYKKPGLPWGQAIRYVISIARQLQFFASMIPPLIHCDIKPQNVIISDDDSCHLIDFEISRFYQPDEIENLPIMGTKLTASPEQFCNPHPDIRSDIYSLGILFYYSLTGEYTITDLIMQELQIDIQKVIYKATMTDPSKRYQTIEQFLEDLFLLTETFRIFS